jgi:hypothetical protein
MSHPAGGIPGEIINKQPHDLLRGFSGEFIDPSLEKTFLTETWEDYKKIPQNIMLFSGIIVLAFVGVDVLAQNVASELCYLLALRVVASLLLVGSSLYIRRAKAYFRGFHTLTFVNQLAGALILTLVGIIARLSFMHNVLHIVLVTLIFYQAFRNRFSYTFIACIFYPTVYLAVSGSISQLHIVDMVRFALYLILANTLGILMLQYLNRSGREEYIRYHKERYLNQELRNTLDKLLQTQQDIKVLQGLIPICSSCKKIRDDQGFWKQLESYIQDHSEAKFSHGICPKCAKELYPEYKVYSE